MRKDRLGRGLGALLGEYADGSKEESAPQDVNTLPVRRIVPNPLQPRKEFAEEELGELVDSIRENGLLQPLVVRPSPSAEGRFELVAGERRFRSIQKLGWTDVPVMIREVDDETLLVLALVENLQREALNPLEEAEGYEALAERFDLTQAEIAKAVGKNRSTVANSLRLLGLPPSVRKLVSTGALSAGHARAILSLSDPVAMADIARKATSEGWSVRETERQCRRGPKKGKSRGSEGSASRDPLVQALESALQEQLSTRARIRGGGKKGKGVIEIPFHSAEDFERLFALIAGVEASDVVS